MTYDRETLLRRAASLQEKTAASSVLWKYTLDDLEVFLLKKITSIRSPLSGKTFTVKPERVSLSEVGKELKTESKAEKVKKASDDFWKADTETSLPKTAAEGKTLPGTLWEYTDDEGGKFYLVKKQTGALKSPFTGKTFTSKPVKNTLSDVSQDLKDSGKKKASDETPSMPKVAMTLEEVTQLKAEVKSELAQPKVAFSWKLDPSFEVVAQQEEKKEEQTEEK